MHWKSLAIATGALVAFGQWRYTKYLKHQKEVEQARLLVQAEEDRRRRIRAMKVCSRTVNGVMFVRPVIMHEYLV